MTSLDLDKLTSPPTLDPSTINWIDTPGGGKVTAYYSPINRAWTIYTEYPATTQHIPGIDANDWPEVWHEIISKEQGS